MSKLDELINDVMFDIATDNKFLSQETVDLARNELAALRVRIAALEAVRQAAEYARKATEANEDDIFRPLSGQEAQWIHDKLAAALDAAKDGDK